jgi:exodeoxyribonuclease VII large subunit
MRHDGWTMSSNRPIAPPSLPFDEVERPTPADGLLAGGLYRETSITRLCSELARAFGEIGRVIVQGEVNNAKTQDTRFITLRDRSFEISVYIPANRAKYCRFRNGDVVAVAGKIELQPKRAQMQLVAFEMTPVGAGAIAAKVEQTRQRLVAAGLTARPRKPLPLLPKAIGVVCGSDAAVRKDIESVVAARFPGFPLIFCEVPVQGPGAVEGILWGLTSLQSRSVDVIVLARGGGDASQLLPFSDFDVCEAICASAIPVVSAIGHDGDRPLSDDVADLRAGTPSIAASMVVPNRAELETRLDRLLRECDHRAVNHLNRTAQRLQNARWSDALVRRIDREHHRLNMIDIHASLERRLSRNEHLLSSIAWNAPLQQRVARAQAELSGLHLRVEALSPLRVLERGYSIVRHADGRVVRDSNDVAVNDRLLITVASGSIVGRVEQVAPSYPLATTSNERFVDV